MQWSRWVKQRLRTANIQDSDVAYSLPYKFEQSYTTTASPVQAPGKLFIGSRAFEKQSS